MFNSISNNEDLNLNENKQELMTEEFDPNTEELQNKEISSDEELNKINLEQQDTKNSIPLNSQTLSNKNMSVKFETGDSTDELFLEAKVELEHDPNMKKCKYRVKESSETNLILTEEFGSGIVSCKMNESRILIAGGNRVEIYNMKQNKIQKITRQENGQDIDVTFALISQSGKLIVCQANGEIELQSGAQEGNETHQRKSLIFNYTTDKYENPYVIKREYPVSDASFSSTNQLFVVAQQYGAELFDFQGNNITSKFPRQMEDVIIFCTAISNEENPRIAVGGSDCNAIVYSKDGQSIFTITRDEEIYCVEFDSQGRLMVGGKDKKACMYDTEYNLVFTVNRTDQISTISFDQYDNMLIGAQDRKCIIQNSSGQQQMCIKRKEEVRSADFNKEGKIIFGSHDGSVMIIKNFKEMRFHQEMTQSIKFVTFGSDGRFAVVGKSRSIPVYDKQCNLLQEITLEDEEEMILTAKQGTNDQILIGTSKNNIMLQDDEGQFSKEFGMSLESSPSCITFSIFNLYFVGCNGVDNESIIFDHNLKRIKSFKVKKGVRCAAFSGDGQRLAFGGDENIVQVWALIRYNDQFNYIQIRQLKREDRIWCVDFSPQGRLVVGGSDKTAAIQDENLMERQVIQREQSIMSASFGPDGRLVLGGKDKLAIVQDQEGNEIKTFKRKEWVECVKFSSDGTLVVGGVDKILELQSSTLSNGMMPQLSKDNWLVNCHDLDWYLTKRLNIQLTKKKENDSSNKFDGLRRKTISSDAFKPEYVNEILEEEESKKEAFRNISLDLNINLKNKVFNQADDENQVQSGQLIDLQIVCGNECVLEQIVKNRTHLFFQNFLSPLAYLIKNNETNEKQRAWIEQILNCFIKTFETHQFQLQPIFMLNLSIILRFMLKHEKLAQISIKILAKSPLVKYTNLKCKLDWNSIQLLNKQYAFKSRENFFIDYKDITPQTKESQLQETEQKIWLISGIFNQQTLQDIDRAKNFAIQENLGFQLFIDSLWTDEFLFWHNFHVFFKVLNIIAIGIIIWDVQEGPFAQPQLRQALFFFILIMVVYETVNELLEMQADIVMQIQRLVQNIMDIVQLPLLIAMFLVLENREQDWVSAWLVSLFLACQTFIFIDLLRAYQQFGWLFMTIRQNILDIWPLLIVTIQLLGMFSLMFYSVVKRPIFGSAADCLDTDSSPDVTEVRCEQENIYWSFFSTFRMGLMGEINIGRFEDVQSPGLTLWLIFGVVFMILVVILNALIAILSDSFERIQQVSIGIGQKERLEVILNKLSRQTDTQCETLWNKFRQLHVVQDVNAAKEQQEEDDEDKDQWQGFVHTIKRQVKQMERKMTEDTDIIKKSLKDENEYLKKEIRELKDLIIKNMK